MSWSMGRPFDGFVISHLSGARRLFSCSHGRSCIGSAPTLPCDAVIAPRATPTRRRNSRRALRNRRGERSDYPCTPGVPARRHSLECAHRRYHRCSSRRHPNNRLPPVSRSEGRGAGEHQQNALLRVFGHRPENSHPDRAQAGRRTPTISTRAPSAGLERCFRPTSQSPLFHCWH